VSRSTIQNNHISNGFHNKSYNVFVYSFQFFYALGNCQNDIPLENLKNEFEKLKSEIKEELKSEIEIKLRNEMKVELKSEVQELKKSYQQELITLRQKNERIEYKLGEEMGRSGHRRK